MDDISEYVRRRCRGVVPNNVLQQFRVVVTEGEFGVHIEPFVGSASLRAMLGSPKKRAIVREISWTIVEHLLQTYSIVGLAWISERKARQDPVTRTEMSFDEVFARSRPPTNQWIRIRKLDDSPK